MSAEPRLPILLRLEPQQHPFPLPVEALRREFDPLLGEWYNCPKLRNHAQEPSSIVVLCGPPRSGKFAICEWLAAELVLPLVVLWEPDPTELAARLLRRPVQDVPSVLVVPESRVLDVPFLPSLLRRAPFPGVVVFLHHDDAPPPDIAPDLLVRIPPLEDDDVCTIVKNRVSHLAPDAADHIVPQLLRLRPARDWLLGDLEQICAAIRRRAVLGASLDDILSGLR